VTNEVSVLTPFDVIEGAAPVGQTGLYVIGSYDSRITFYSQQVRALELVHGLHSQWHPPHSLIDAHQR
jgi:hypothetical protein